MPEPPSEQNKPPTTPPQNRPCFCQFARARRRGGCAAAGAVVRVSPAMTACPCFNRPGRGLSLCRAPTNDVDDLTNRANADGLSSAVLVGAAVGGAASRDCAEAMGAANSVMATESAAMRRRGTNRVSC